MVSPAAQIDEFSLFSAVIVAPQETYVRYLFLFRERCGEAPGGGGLRLLLNSLCASLVSVPLFFCEWTTSIDIIFLLHLTRNKMQRIISFFRRISIASSDRFHIVSSFVAWRRNTNDKLYHPMSVGTTLIGYGWNARMHALHTCDARPPARSHTKGSEYGNIERMRRLR